MSAAASQAPHLATLPFGAPRPEPAAILPPGTVVDQYVIEDKVGEGGMATVYTARHPVLGKRAAVKVLGRQHCTNPAAVTLFLQEARTISQIGHPNLVDVFGFGRLSDGRSYFVMDLLEGEALVDAMNETLLPLARVYDIVTQVCEALQAAHDRNIVHLDLKPENIFLVPLGRGRTLVKLLDFGIARLLGVPDEQARGGERLFRGTPTYASPEQCLALDNIDTRSDLYSLGVVTYELCTGKVPFKGANPAETLAAHVKQHPMPPRRLRTDLPVELEQLILRLLYKDPARRPTLEEVRETLGALSHRTSLRPVLLPPPAPPVRWRRLGVAAVAMSVLATAGFVIERAGGERAAQGASVASRPTLEDDLRLLRAGVPTLTSALPAGLEPGDRSVEPASPRPVSEPAHRRASRRPRRERVARPIDDRPAIATPPPAPPPPARALVLDDDYLMDEQGRRR